MDTTETSELNRWREAGKAIGRKLGAVEERERIIKLLETKALKNVSPDIHSLELLHNQLVNSLIALIKGEN
jgi:hypothetical protein